MLFPTLSLCLTITRIKVEPGLQPAAAAAALPIAAQVAAAAQAGGIPGARKVVVLKSSMLKGLNQAVVLNKVSYTYYTCVMCILQSDPPNDSAVLSTKLDWMD